MRIVLSFIVCAIALFIYQSLAVSPLASLTWPVIALDLIALYIAGVILQKLMEMRP
ncbi:MAG: hypothetical protein V4662_11925 [Verrucomicrobiota bacterium]